MKLIAHYNDKTTEFDIDLSNSWFEIKMKLVKAFNISGGYVDLEFSNTRPIREFGKQALLLGVMERVYDDFHVADFIINLNRELIFKVHPVDASADKTVRLDYKKKKHCVFDETDFPELTKKQKEQQPTIDNENKQLSTENEQSTTENKQLPAENEQPAEKKPVLNAWSKKLTFTK